MKSSIGWIFTLLRLKWFFYHWRFAITYIRVISTFKAKFFAAFFVMFVINTGVDAALTGIPAPSTTTSIYCGGKQVGTTSTGHFSGPRGCWLAIGNSPALFSGSGTNFYLGDYVILNDEFRNAYFPAAGDFGIRLYICRSTEVAWCTISKSIHYIDGSKRVNGNTLKTIAELNPNFGGNASSYMPGDMEYNICLAIIDEQGVAWRTDTDAITCADAQGLPTEPATCRINGGADLNVYMGTLERGDIAVTPNSSDNDVVRTEFSISCSGDAAVTLSTSFQFTPIIMDGKELISTTAANLGIAAFYNGQAVGPSTPPVTESFSSGNYNRELLLQAIRNPNVTLKEIPTGSFTASAVMVMTEQ